MIGPTSSCAWFLALRYLLTRWVNFIGIVGIALAVWALILVTAVFSGFIAEIQDHIRGATADLTLLGVKADQSYAAIQPILEGDPDVAAAAPRLSHYGVLFPQGFAQRTVAMVGASDGGPAQDSFFRLIGVDPKHEVETTRFRDWVTLQRSVVVQVESPDEPFAVSRERALEGRQVVGIPVRESDLMEQEPGIVLPRRRFVSLSARFRPGQPVELVTARFVRAPDRDERLVTVRRIRPVSGAFETMHRVFDDTHAFLHIDDLRSMLGHPQELDDSIDIVSEVAIKLRDGADPAVVAARLEAKLRPLTGGLVQTWQQQNKVFLGAVHQERSLMKIILFAVMLVAGFLVYATIHMMVTQKTKDIGVLTALGATPSTIASIFVVAGLVIATIGCGIGVVLGIASEFWLNPVNDWLESEFAVELFPKTIYALPKIPTRIELDWVLQVVGMAFALTLLVALLQARRAARLDPVQTLSYE